MGNQAEKGTEIVEVSTPAKAEEIDPVAQEISYIEIVGNM
jgi:hypothetical protein